MQRSMKPHYYLNAAAIHAVMFKVKDADAVGVAIHWLLGF